MAEVHGSETVLLLDAQDISLFSDKSDGKFTSDEHESTCYGADGHEVATGLKKHAYSIGGKYVNGATGPRAYIQLKVGTKVAFEKRPEGTGSGLPKETSTVHIKEFNASSPVADIVRWTAELTVSGVVTYGTQA
jgi:hypothetical protein